MGEMMEKHFAPVFEGLFFLFFLSLSPEKILQNAGERKKKPAAESGGIRTEEGVLAFFYFFAKTCV